MNVAAGGGGGGSSRQPGKSSSDKDNDHRYASAICNFIGGGLAKKSGKMCTITKFDFVFV